MFYSVAVGRKVGIFLNWHDCAESVKDYGCAIFRKFKKLSQAVNYLNEHRIVFINVYTTDDTMGLDVYRRHCATSEVYYAIAIGRKTGVFLSWRPQCRESVCDYPGALYRKMPSLAEATQFLNRHGVENSIIEVHTSDDTLSMCEHCERNNVDVPVEVDYVHNNLFKLKNGFFAEVKRVGYGGVGVDIHQRHWKTGEREGRGVVLTSFDWKSLLNVAPRLKNTLQKIKRGEPETIGHDIGGFGLGGPYVGVSNDVINIGYGDFIGMTFTPDSTRCITLHECEWEHLMNIRPLIEHAIKRTLDAPSNRHM